MNRLAPQLALVLVAGALATLVAAALGAANLGTALTFGQVVVVFGALGLMLRAR